MMSPVDKTYITSERFIHDGLLRQAEAAVSTIYDLWRKFRRIDPVLITWPAETIQTEAGEPIEGMCVMDLPLMPTTRSKAIHAMVARTRAYGLLLIEQKERCVQAVLESPHGARCWTIPILDHGDIHVLGDPAIQDDGYCVGLLWRPRNGQPS
jgi:hypothetical protein